MLFDFANKTRNNLVEYIRTFRQNREQEANKKQRKVEFLTELEQARIDLETARRNYNFANESALLDYYIYEIKAAETRLNYYVCLAKQEGMYNDWFMSNMLFGRYARREESL